MTQLYTLRTFNCMAGPAFVQVGADSFEEAEIISRGKLREMLAHWKNPESDEWPSELFIEEVCSGTTQCWSFLD